jgi:hypothetical protein
MVGRTFTLRIPLLGVLGAVLLGLAVGNALTPAAEQSRPPLLAGTVRSAGGGPLAGVWVQELGLLRGELTKPDGGFRFHRGKAVVLLFAKDGFRPLLRAAAGVENSVVMEPETGTPLVIGSCRKQGRSPIRELEIAKVHGLQVTRIAGPETIGYQARYMQYFVSGGTGPGVED